MRASVIIPTFNKYERLKLMLHTLEFQSYDKNSFEVIIINDGSTDETNEFITKNTFDFNLRYFIKNNKGRASARNTGVENSKNEFLIFVDDDTVLDKNFIEEHLKAQQKIKSVTHGMIREIPYVKFFKDPTNGILYDDFKKIDLSLKELNKKCISIEDLDKNFSKISDNSKIAALEKIIQAVFKYDTKSWYWVTFSGGNICIPKDWVINTGFFDEIYSLNWGCEDIDLGYRLMEKGYQFNYCKEAVNYHLDHYRKYFKDEHSKNMKYFYNKYKNNDFFLFQDFVEGKCKAKEIIEVISKK